MRDAVKDRVLLKGVSILDSQEGEPESTFSRPRPPRCRQTISSWSPVDLGRGVRRLFVRCLFPPIHCASSSDTFPIISLVVGKVPPMIQLPVAFIE